MSPSRDRRELMDETEPKRPPEPFNIPEIAFVGEQDGPPERDLKARLSETFQRDPAIAHAYLALVDYGDRSGSHVALCVRSSAGEDAELARRIGGVFAGLFGPHEHLDVIFVSQNQERSLVQVCRPFYVSD